MKTTKFDTIIAMNLLGLSVLTVGYGLTVLAEIPAMNQALATGMKLYPMPEVLEFDSTPKAIAARAIAAARK